MLEHLLKEYEIVDLSCLIAARHEGGEPAVPPYGHIVTRSFALGDSYTSHLLVMSEHCQTHCDAPLHTPSGKLSVEKVPLESFIGPCCVFHMSDLPDNYAVSVSDVKNWEEKNGKIRKGDIALFYFGRSASHLAEDFPGVSKEAGDYLAEKGVKMVGADTCAPDPYNVWHPDPGRKGLPLHESLLPRGIIIMEGLANLDKLPPRGAYFIGFPLKIKGGSGSPLRAVALVQKG